VQVIIPVLLASSLLAVVLVLALAREVRLRRALQQLLTRILNYWRKRHDKNDPSDRRSRGPGRAGRLR
jgi:hypothetical protein